ncbi:MAG TPA: hypothetical protein VEI57_13435 [Nitrospirota bacterium]|nr:hypothetical protein [Nitrospirota bacterium]
MIFKFAKKEAYDNPKNDLKWRCAYQNVRKRTEKRIGARSIARQVITREQTQQWSSAAIAPDSGILGLQAGGGQ